MNANAETVRARRYLLGQASDEECAALEEEYFERQEAVDRIAAAEDDLIEDYLADQLDPADRDRFEQAYLSAPRHRVRVETIRRLVAHGARSAPESPRAIPAVSSTRRTDYRPWLALAASLLVVASLSLWVFSPFGGTPTDVADNRAPQPVAPGAPAERTATPASAPRIFALTLSPVGVRGGTESPPAAIPAGTDVVVLRLEGDAESRKLTARRASIRTVEGRDAWQGAVTSDNNPPPGTVARLDVPAANLPADDYVITLYGTNQAGAEMAWAQYFLRVRAR